MRGQFPTQENYDVRCEWGTHGVETLAPLCNAVVIVDILSFTTCVSIAVDRGVTILPWLHHHESAAEFAQSKSARLVGQRSNSHPSLSPQSWETAAAGERFVLPSLNGATLSRLTGRTETVACCFLNAAAVAQYLSTIKPPIAVIPAGRGGMMAVCVRHSKIGWVRGRSSVCFPAASVGL